MYERKKLGNKVYQILELEKYFFVGVGNVVVF